MIHEGIKEVSCTVYELLMVFVSARKVYGTELLFQQKLCEGNSFLTSEESID